MEIRPPVERGGSEAAVPRQLRLAAGIAWRFLVVAAAIAIVALALAKLRVVVLPVVFALFAAAVLAPATVWLRRHGVPRALAASAVLGAGILVAAGVIAVIAPQVATEVDEVRTNVEAGIAEVSDWLFEGPLDVSPAELERYRERGLDELRERAGPIAGGVLGGAYLVVELVVGLILSVVVLFFFLKDGDRMWPWIVRLFPARARRQADEVGRIGWATLAGYLRGVAIVAFVDALFIGLALWLIGVPLVLPLALLTFVGGFFPIVGAFAAGAAAALVALVSNGFVEAILVVAAATLVQQLEGHVLQPLIVGRAVKLHPLAVILAIAAGGVIWGIPGAFLAVPLVAVVSQAASHLRSSGGEGGRRPEPAGGSAAPTPAAGAAPTPDAP